MSVGKAVLRVRQEKKLTQRQVGRRAGLATSYVSRIENGHIQPTMVTLARIAEALGVATAEILDVSDNPRPTRAHTCPVSHSGACVGELIRSHKGKRPRVAQGELTYGPEELRLLRTADYVILHGGKEVRAALKVVLDGMVARTAPASRRPSFDDLDAESPRHSEEPPGSV